jgi:hypothetical protein
MVSFLSVLHRADEFLKGNIMTRSVFAELLKHNHRWPGFTRIEAGTP